VASEVFVGICVFLRSFSVSWVEQLCLYPPRTYMVSYEFLYVVLIP
jgi:hypothetical protein